LNKPLEFFTGQKAMTPGMKPDNPVNLVTP